MKRLWLEHRELALLSIAVVLNFALCWWLLPRNDWFTNIAFMILGGLTATLTALVSERLRRKQLRRDLAHALYVELADRVARCCFDMESPWSAYLELANCQASEMHRFRLRKFAPERPLIYEACAPQMAVLGTTAAQGLVQFYYRLSAWRRDHESTLQDGGSNSERIDPKYVNFLASRLRQTIAPGLRALEDLAPLVEEHSALEAASIATHDLQQKDGLRASTLRERLRALL